MIWYRHWLEMRWRLLLAGLVAVGLGSATSTAVTIEDAGGIFAGLRETGLAQTLGTSDLLLWVAFVSRISTLMVGVGLVLGGNGFRTWYPDRWGPNDAGTQFTLSLPVSRFRLLWTRHAATWISGALAVLLALGAQCAVLWWEGRSVPLAPMAISSAVVACILLAWTTVMGALQMTLPGGLSFVGLIMCLFAFLPATLYAATRVPARSVPFWFLATVAGVVAAGALMLTKDVTEAEEF